MNNTAPRREFHLVESDEMFWDDLRDLSERLGWEISQTLKACFALGWDQLSQTLKSNEKECKNDERDLE